MATYTVKQISEMLKTSEETVRRWIRTGALGAEKATSRKKGSTVSAEDLTRFIAKNPKFTAAATASLAFSSPAIISVVIGGLAGGLLSLPDSKKSKDISSKDVEAFLNKKIHAHERKIKALTENLERIQEEISIEKLNLEKYKYAIENLDLNVIADEVNSHNEK